MNAVVEPDDAVFQFVGGEQFEALAGGRQFVFFPRVFDDGTDAGQDIWDEISDFDKERNRIIPIPWKGARNPLSGCR